jgi:ATP-dependent Lhr-like helicase
MAEEAMRDPTIPAVIAATLTLELGVDIGQLERVIQLGSPVSVASFLQRLGRSGRRGSPAEMLFVCPERPPSSHDNWPQQIPWDLLQAIAIIQLYVEERWIEPMQPTRYPFSLLYHQTMSTLAGMGEMSPAALAQRVLTLPPFNHISQDDFRELLQHLIAIDHIQRTEEGGLIVGLTGEREVRNFHFYAVFMDKVEYVVSDETREIGSVATLPLVGERFALAGRTWETLEVDHRRRTVFVKLVKGTAKIGWQGGVVTIHTKVLERMRRVLLEDTVYTYLQPNAVNRLNEARRMARSAGFDDGHIFFLSGITYCVLPWLGAIEYQTLVRCVQTLHTDSVQVVLRPGFPPYYVALRLVKGDVQALHQALVSLAQEHIDPLDLVGPDETPPPQKYDEFIPPDLLRKAFAADYLDVVGMQKALVGWQRTLP